MSHYLLDTHTAIWHFRGSSAISNTAKNIINDLSKTIYISIASAWEVAIKINIGKLDFQGGVAEFLRLADKYHINILPINGDHLSVYESLPMHHRDPFDRLLISTAINENLILISGDRNIPLYDVNHIW